MFMRRNFLSAAAGLALACIVTPVLAQSWPERPVTIIVPFAAGGNTDGFARMAAQHLGEAFGKTFIVENKPGAGGAIAADYVAKSTPDGYTLFLAALPVMAVVTVSVAVRVWVPVVTSVVLLLNACTPLSPPVKV